MEEIRVGVNLPESTADPRYVRAWMRRLARAGFDCFEISLDAFPLIIGGEIQRDYAALIGRLLRDHAARCSAHIGLGLNLRDAEAIQRRTLCSSIQLCAELGLDPLVLHYERRSRDASAERRFLEAHVQAAEEATRYGLTLCIENIEVERLEPVLRFVQQVNRPNFRLCLDTGHAFLASRYFQFDFLQAVRAALPHLGHLHLNDNTGTFEELRIQDRSRYDQLPMRYRYTFGRGDIHLPPFWGKLPFAEVFPLLRQYRGLYICEYNSWDFLPFNAAIQARVREEAAR